MPRDDFPHMRTGFSVGQNQPIAAIAVYELLQAYDTVCDQHAATREANDLAIRVNRLYLLPPPSHRPPLPDDVVSVKQVMEALRQADLGWISGLLSELVTEIEQHRTAHERVLEQIRRLSEVERAEDACVRARERYLGEPPDASERP